MSLPSGLVRPLLVTPGWEPTSTSPTSEAAIACSPCRMAHMPYRELAHTADTGLEATADSFAGLVSELATGMFGLMAPLEPTAAEQWIVVRVEAPTFEDLAVDTLSLLLYNSEVEDMIFCSFEVEKQPDTLAIRVRAGGVPAAGVELVGPPIKAVTYHRLLIEERGDGWFGRIYFDV